MPGDDGERGLCCCCCCCGSSEFRFELSFLAFEASPPFEMILASCITFISKEALAVDDPLIDVLIG